MILIDQLKQIYMDGVLDPVDTTQWYPKIMRKDYTIGLNITETAVDDPDPAFYENYVCGAMRNYTGYCSPEVDKMVDEQSAISDVEKRKQLAWAIEKKLADDDARPISSIGSHGKVLPSLHEDEFVFVVRSGARASYRNTRDTRNTLTRVRMQRATSASGFSSFVLRIISEARLSLQSSRDLFD